MNLDRDWNPFALEAEEEAFGFVRIAAAHNALRAEVQRLREARASLAGSIEASLLFHFGKTAKELAIGATEANTGGLGNWVWLSLEALKKAGRLG